MADNRMEVVFSPEAWKKMLCLRDTAVKMFRSRREMLVSLPDFVGLVEWFWKNRDKFTVYILEDGEKKEFRT